MIRQYCDNCGEELTPDNPGVQDLDTFAVQGQDSVHFQISVVDRSLIYDRDCFDSLLLNSLNLEVTSVDQEKEADTDRALAEQEGEPKPHGRGSWMGQKSPKGEWSWQGTGDPSDDWQRINPVARR